MRRVSALGLRSQEIKAFPSLCFMAFMRRSSLTVHCEQQQDKAVFTQRRGGK